MIWIVVAVLIAGVAIGVVTTLRLVHWSWQRKDQLEASVAITDHQPVTVVGTVRIVGEPLISPLSARRCVLFETYASLYEEPSGVADAPRALVAQLCERAMIPFELATSRGAILIDGRQAEIELAPTPVFPRRPEREARFLREHDRDERLVETTTFEEITVDPDALVAVRGVARVEGQQVRLVATETQPLVICPPSAVSR